MLWRLFSCLYSTQCSSNISGWLNVVVKCDEAIVYLCFYTIPTSKYLLIATRSGRILRFSLSSIVNPLNENKTVSEKVQPKTKKQKVDEQKSTSLILSIQQLRKQTVTLNTKTEDVLIAELTSTHLIHCTSDELFLCSSIHPLSFLPLSNDAIVPKSLLRVPGSIKSTHQTTSLTSLSTQDSSHKGANIVSKEFYRAVIDPTDTLSNTMVLLSGDTSGAVQCLPFVNPNSKVVKDSTFLNMKEPIQNLIIFKCQVNGVWKDVLLVIGTYGKLLVITNQQNRRIEKEYMITTGEVIGSSCVFKGNLLFCANGSTYLVELFPPPSSKPPYSSSILPTSLTPYLLPLPPTVCHLNVMEEGNVDMIAITTEGRLIGFRVPSSSYLSQKQGSSGDHNVKSKLY